ncbi:MAG TPA: sigma-70 family RNA polymerase sigma factor, partial [Gaiellaceae bacterium]|nr:sigma-70 family RNA polymerase sigma factor [Gaiellaceae bacterium]
MSAPPEQIRKADSSFEQLYRRHRRDVYGAVLRDVRDPDEAEDVTQTAFMNAYRAMRRGERPEKPRAWLVTIARNVCRRRYRNAAMRPQEVHLDPEIAAALMDVDGPTAGEITAAIRRLPEAQRNAILLREIQGRSYAEIADALGLSLAAVETLIFRARGRLSEELEAAEHVPATQKRGLRGLLALPLPGFGKLGEIGFSFSRTAAAAFVGGAAIIVAPIGDQAPTPTPPEANARPAIVREVQAPTREPRHAVQQTESSKTTKPARASSKPSSTNPAKASSSNTQPDAAAGAVSTVQGTTGTVTGAVTGAVTDAVSVPPLPISPP